MPPIRVMVVDDSTVIRRLVSDALASDPEIEVAGVAANGAIALAKIPQINPDVITLDMEMPEMDGLQTLVELRKLYPRLPVIMFSTLTARGAAETLEALAKGATDYVTKPANVGSVTVAMQSVREELIPRIKTFARPQLGRVAALSGTARPLMSLSRATLRPSDGPIDVVAIGVSTGGPNALAAILPKLAVDFPVPIVIVQHMPPVFTQQLAERLNVACRLRVYEAKHGDVLTAGTIAIAPGGRHMIVSRRGNQIVLNLNDEPPENSCRPAVDVLFRSVAEVYGSRALGVVLTGMGQDGFRGAQLIREQGGRVFAQDEASSVVWGMPGMVAQAKLADKVLPLVDIAFDITATAAIGRNSRNPTFHQKLTSV